MLPGSPKKEDRGNRLLPRHSTMHLLGPSLLLLEYLAFSDSAEWKFERPHTLYSWDGACVWIPCQYKIPRLSEALENLTLYSNYEYDDVTKNFKGFILYEDRKPWNYTFHPKRVQILGDRSSNCTIFINPVLEQDNGHLGLRLITKTDRWMEKIDLNVSKTPLSPHIRLPPEIRESKEVTLTCLLNFSCPGYQIRLQWSLEEPGITLTNLTTLTTKTVSTQSKLTFQPHWTHHGRNLTCQLWDHKAERIVSEETVLLDVKHAPKEVTTVIQNPMRIREGDTVTLSCNYSSSNPRVTRYEWDFQGFRREDSPGVLIIQKVAWDTMPITCAACNQWCSWAPSVNLDVQHAPKDVRILQISPSSEIHSGHRVLLGCNFSSSRPRDVHFFWKKNGIFLKEGKELGFDSISPEDAGSYNCFVKNSIGQTMSEARMLRVLYAPRKLRVAISPKEQVMEGKKAVLTCESDANPPIFQYTWFDWNNQNLHHYDQMLRLDPVKIQHSGAYWCEAANQLGRAQSPPSTLTVYYSPETIGRRVAVGVGFCLATLLLVFWGVKLQRSWKRIRSQQGLQESSSGQSFFVRKQKVRRAPLSEDPHSLGCYNPVMEDAISYATLRFPLGETDTPRPGDAGTLETEGPSPNRDDTVTYSVLQKRRVGDYENVLPASPEDEGIHYSELVHLGVGERPPAQDAVEYVTLKH
ncbi:B-cell receptor CD22 isoform X2 [Ailuropoda melanoleuca]|uniref:B-cell receptor CD22 isoform X2 n=1 Tax=Ailuropoda melanoleuca TaxID=9646 RepID=UPI00059B3BEA|nr:B-cell receptor CD22 isoform X2 [Ailuropoda melanoleuca]